MIWRPPIEDTVTVAEDRDTGLCDGCGKEDKLYKNWDGQQYCLRCYQDVNDEI